MAFSKKDNTSSVLASLVSPQDQNDVDPFAISESIKNDLATFMSKARADHEEADRLFEAFKSDQERNRSTRPSASPTSSNSSKARRAQRLNYRNNASPYSTGSSSIATFSSLSPSVVDPNKATTVNKECTICHRVFFNRQSMLRHVKRAHPDAPEEVVGTIYRTDNLPETFVKCKVCSKAFPTDESLATHMVRHLAASRYYCMYCPRSYVYRNEFKKHLTRVHDSHHDATRELLDACLSLGSPTQSTLTPNESPSGASLSAEDGPDSGIAEDECHQNALDDEDGDDDDDDAEELLVSCLNLET